MSGRQAEIEQWLEMSNPNATAMTYMHENRNQLRDDNSVISNPFPIEANKTNPPHMMGLAKME